MNKKFTPGGWYWNPGCYQLVPGDSCDVRDESGDWIASVHTQFKGVVNGEANARLIAAAPEMFELLEKIAGELYVERPSMSDEIQSLLTKITTP